ncbi:MAG: glycerophosphodiester phosphodiesterase [Chloroflexi bacterium]|nr:MAG: glycerophosphodiester phosphodiesterase [Chloroflexota bacterium]
MDWSSIDYPLIFAHRGASYAAPENTLSAFGLAVAEKADGIELDVQLSADGWPVIIHDFSVDRTTNGTGKVAHLTLNELQALKIEGEERIPTLNEVFETFGSQLIYNVEIKDLSLRDRGLEAAIADQIEAHHLEDKVLISSFNPFSLKRFRRYAPQGIYTALLRGNGALRFSYVLGGGDGDNPHFSLVNPDYMAWATKHQYKVNVWTVDDPEEARRLVKLGVHGLITNKPAFLRSSLEQA